MVIPPPAASPKSEPPNRQKMQQAASAALYIGLVLLALWIIRAFLPAVGWACVIAIALWPLLRKIEAHSWFTGRTTLVATILTLGVALLVVLPVAIGVGQATHEAHDMLAWFKDVQENGIALPDVVQRFQREAMASGAVESIGGLDNCHPAAPAIGWKCGPISKRVAAS